MTKVSTQQHFCFLLFLAFVSHLLIQLCELIMILLSVHSWLWPEHKAGGRKTSPTNCESCQETGDPHKNDHNSRILFIFLFSCLQSNLITDSHGSLLFDPPLLDFGDWYCIISLYILYSPLILTLLLTVLLVLCGGKK